MIGNVVLAMATFVVGTAFMTDQKQILLVVEGHDKEIRKVRTLTDQVGEMLVASGVVVPASALVFPSPQAELRDGMVVLVDLYPPPPDAAPELEFLSLDTAGKWEGRLMWKEARQEARLQLQRERRIARIQKAREERREAAAAERAAERKAEEEAQAAAEAAAAAEAEAQAEAANEEAAPKSTITGCDFDWRAGPAQVEKLIRCAAERWSVPGGPDKAVAVARCESGMNPYREGSGVGGVFQHSLRYWPERATRFGFDGWSVYNGRANVMVAIQYAHLYGWSAWSGCA